MATSDLMELEESVPPGWYLEIHRENKKTGFFPLRQTRVELTRALCSTGLKGTSGVSRKHAVMEWLQEGTEGTEGKWTIRDLKSTNGTFVNQVLIDQIGQTPLKTNDVISLGGNETMQESEEFLIIKFKVTSEYLKLRVKEALKFAIPESDLFNMVVKCSITKGRTQSISIVFPDPNLVVANHFIKTELIEEPIEHPISCPVSSCSDDLASNQLSEEKMFERQTLTPKNLSVDLVRCDSQFATLPSDIIMPKDFSGLVTRKPSSVNSVNSQETFMKLERKRISISSGSLTSDHASDDSGSDSNRAMLDGDGKSPDNTQVCASSNGFETTPEKNITSHIPDRYEVDYKRENLDDTTVKIQQKSLNTMSNVLESSDGSMSSDSDENVRLKKPIERSSRRKKGVEIEYSHQKFFPNRSDISQLKKQENSISKGAVGSEDSDRNSHKKAHVKESGLKNTFASKNVVYSTAKNLHFVNHTEKCSSTVNGEGIVSSDGHFVGRKRKNGEQSCSYNVQSTSTSNGIKVCSNDNFTQSKPKHQTVHQATDTSQDKVVVPSVLNNINDSKGDEFIQTDPRLHNTLETTGIETTNHFPDDDSNNHTLSEPAENTQTFEDKLSAPDRIPNREKNSLSPKKKKKPKNLNVELTTTNQETNWNDKRSNTCSDQSYFGKPGSDATFVDNLKHGSETKSPSSKKNKSNLASTEKYHKSSNPPNKENYVFLNHRTSADLSPDEKHVSYSNKNSVNSAKKQKRNISNDGIEVNAHGKSRRRESGNEIVLASQNSLTSDKSIHKTDNLKPLNISSSCKTVKQRKLSNPRSVNADLMESEEQIQSNNKDASNLLFSDNLHKSQNVSNNDHSPGLKQRPSTDLSTGEKQVSSSNKRSVKQAKNMQSCSYVSWNDPSTSTLKERIEMDKKGKEMKRLNTSIDYSSYSRLHKIKKPSEDVDLASNNLHLQETEASIWESDILSTGPPGLLLSGGRTSIRDDKDVITISSDEEGVPDMPLVIKKEICEVNDLDNGICDYDECSDEDIHSDHQNSLAEMEEQDILEEGLKFDFFPVLSPDTLAELEEEDAEQQQHAILPKKLDKKQRKTLLTEALPLPRRQSKIDSKTEYQKCRTSVKLSSSRQSLFVEDFERSQETCPPPPKKNFLPNKKTVACGVDLEDPSQLQPICNSLCNSFCSHAKSSDAKVNAPPRPKKFAAITSELPSNHNPLFHQPNLPVNAVQQGMIQQKCRTGNIPSIAANLPHGIFDSNLILTLLTFWNPTWLKEHIRETPPPLTTWECKDLLLNYNTQEEYLFAYFPLLAHEMWEWLYISWNDKNREPIFQARVDKYRIVSDSLVELLCRTNLQDKVLTETRSNLELSEGIVLEVQVHFCVSSDTKTQNTLGYVVSQKVRNCGHKQVLMYSIYIRNYGAEIDMNKFITLRKLDNVRLLVQQAQAIGLLGKSRLLPYVLDPVYKSGQNSTDPQFIKYRLAEHPVLHQMTYNNKQKEAITVAESLVVQNIEKPIFLIIQGPPGTGKTHMILGIIMQIICGEKKAGPILLLAPSHAAVDEIGRRLIDLEYCCKHLKQEFPEFVRFGQLHLIHEDVKPYSLDRRIQHDQSQLKRKVTCCKEEIARLDAKEKHLTEETESLRTRPDCSKTRLKQKQNELCEVIKQRFEEDSKWQSLSCQLSNKWSSKRKVLEKADIYLSTLNGCRQIPKYENFSCCIVDEATQCTEPEILTQLLSFNLSKVILIGDLQQLPATIRSTKASHHGYQQSMFERFYKRLKDTQSENIIMLTDQYRMHKEICAFPSKEFYDGKLVSIPHVLKSPFPLKPYILFDFEDSQAESGVGFQYLTLLDGETEFVVKLCFEVHKVTNYNFNIGIITPSHEHRKKIRSRLGTLQRVEVNTVDGFQGREKDIIILLCARLNGTGNIGFLNNLQRLNVAITRASHCLIICGDISYLSRKDEIWAKLTGNAIAREAVISTNTSAPVQELVQNYCMLQS